MNIEEVAKEDPDAIIKQPVNIFKGIDSKEALEFVEKMGFKGESSKNVNTFIKKRQLYK
jgi:succinyl-CoA synthetase beta subunit